MATEQPTTVTPMQRNSSSLDRAQARSNSTSQKRWMRNLATAAAAAFLVAGAMAQRQMPANGGNTVGAAGGAAGGAPAVSTRTSNLPRALSASNVPLPSNLSNFVSDFNAAVRLGRRSSGTFRRAQTA
jgi:hypothetical protein